MTEGYHPARTARIVDGTDELLHRTVVKELLADKAKLPGSGGTIVMETAQGR